jgi:hypothetical protein
LITPGPVTLREGLQAFCAWLGPVDPTAELWAFPASFDCVILANAYRAVGLAEPWHYRSVRCMRTLASFKKAPRVEAETKHCALSDAKAQMLWLQAMLKVGAP